MVVKEFPNFLDWILGASGLFGIILLVAVSLGIFVGYLVASFRHGPFEAFDVVAKVLFEAVPDFLGTSPRRINAMARLAIKEAWERKVVLATFALFFAALLFGGWFMNSGSDHPDRVYVNFVLWGTQMLVLLVGILLSSFSLPDDIRNKTIYTVVTKPVRATEIVLGRILGFGLLATLMLALMGIVSFFFVWRGLSHEHLLAGDTQTLAEFVEIEDGLSRRGKQVQENAYMECETTSNSGHNHRIDLIREIRSADDPLAPVFQKGIVKQIPHDNGTIEYHMLVCAPFAGHTHPVSIDGEGENARITVGPAVGFFRARVPVYAGTLGFLDREGKPKKGGISVGREWTYRGYVDGGSGTSPTSLSRALFDFENFTENKFVDADTLKLDLNLSIFRTFKADIETRVRASVTFSSIPADPNNETRFESEPVPFKTNEYTLQTLKIPRKLSGRMINSEGEVVEEGIYDLFEDYAGGGGHNLRLTLRCEDRSQYIGVARADVYFRANDDVYWLNFLKGYIGIWCQLMIVISLGVAFSTFLNAPLTMLAAAATLIVGFSSTFIRDLRGPDAVGGGPIESLVRVITQKNMIADMDTGIATTLMVNIDKLLLRMLDALTYLAPDFSRLNFSDFLTHGYSVGMDRMLVAVSITLAFVVGLSLLGYFSLKTREIAK